MMNSQKIKIFLFFIIGAVLGGLVMHFCSNYSIEKKKDTVQSEVVSNQNNNGNFQQNNDSNGNQNNTDIDDLTEEKTVIDYVKANRRLPDYYLTKTEARNQGWIASKGNLCDVLPGKAIGGDKFSNREKQLPKDGQYFEADVNYNCGNRGADRIVFTKNGDVWLTHDHYRSFKKQ